MHLPMRNANASLRHQLFQVCAHAVNRLDPVVDEKDLAAALKFAADGIAGNAFMATTIAAAVAAGTWAGLEYYVRGKASVLGFCSGAVAGLVASMSVAVFMIGMPAGMAARAAVMGISLKGAASVG